MSKSKSKRIMTMGLSAVLGSCLLITGVSATTGTKKISAFYNNIKVSYNGEQKYLSQEPFMYNNTVYVPVRGISEISGAEVKWGNNTVTINQAAGTNINGGSVGNIDQQMADKNYQIAKLTNERDTLKKKLEQYEGPGGSGVATLTDTALEATEKFLNDNYCDSYDVDWDINLEQKGSKLKLTVEYDSRRDKNDFNDMSKKRLEGFLEDLCEETQKRHKDVAITGVLVDSRNDINLGDFSLSSSGKFDYEAERLPESLNDFEKRLEDRYKEITSLTSTALNTSFKLPVYNIELEDKHNTIYFTVTLTVADAEKDYWNKLDSNGRQKIETILTDITRDIEDEYRVTETQGEIKDYHSNLMASFDGEKDRTYFRELAK